MSGEPTPDLNLDTLSRWLGKDNIGYAIIEDHRLLVLLDMGATVNMIMPECVASFTDLRKEGISIDQPFDYQG